MKWVFGIAAMLSVATQAFAEQRLSTRAISLDDRDALVELLGTALGCQLSQQLMADNEPAPLYQNEASACTAIDVRDIGSGAYFTDDQCSVSVAYEPPNLLDYCSTAVDKARLGNADDLQDKPPVWTLSPGNRYRLSALELDGVEQPYMARVTYKEVETDGGSCRLEMRIYKSIPTATGLNSLIAFHGGSWTSRGFGFFGLEMTIPQFTQEGFVVFAPFYRLLDSKEGNAACHNATIQEITADAADALDWVVTNAAQWGASDYPVVFGQSAGGHLAASVSVQKPEQVSNAVLFYPPTDFSDFVQQINDDLYTNEQGLGILERVLGGPAVSADISTSPIVENTLPAIVEADPARYPPMFFLHGQSDELVGARQSLRLCRGLNGDVSAADGFTAAPDLRQILSCDERDSELHLIREGKHALDVCLAATAIPTDICPSGSMASRQLVADSVTQSVVWATLVANKRTAMRDETLAGEPGSSSGGGGGSADLSMLLFLFWFIGLARSKYLWQRRT